MASTNTNANEERVTLRCGKYLVKCTLTYLGSRIYVAFPFNRTMIAEIKSMQGAKWHGFDTPPRKIWSITICRRNAFRLAFMQGEKVYTNYDADIPPYISERTLYDHQLEMAAFSLARRKCILAGEAGTGKSLVAIEVMEYIKKHEGLNNSEAWYVGPNNGVRAVSRELIKWNSTVKPLMMTYNALTTKIQHWQKEAVVPKVVILDESSKLKNATAQRSQAAMHLIENMATDSYVILMTGTPSPKAPTDWWSQSEIACPGFLKEGHVSVLKKRLSIIEERESASGGMYPHIVTWLDDETKCAVCGELQAHPNHDEDATIFGGDDSKIHNYHPSVNEVHLLYKRLKGLVDIRLKADCLDLPEKVYRVVKVMPTQEVLRAAKLIKAKAPRAITALTLLRELSDGFQYTEEVVGETTCTECGGSGELLEDIPERDLLAAQDFSASNSTKTEIPCYCCDGKGVVPLYKRATDSYVSPKDDVFIDFLDEYNDVGRFIVWGGFTGTIDRLVGMAHQQGWHTLRYDKLVEGQAPDGSIVSVDDLLDAMDNSHPRYKELQETFPRVCFVGNPDAGGMALTLHSSPIALYYSNSFNGESRIQSEDRGHRIGMNKEKGFMIVDLIHLKSDLLVLENLKKKKKLQNMTLDVLDDAFTCSDTDIERYEKGL